MSRSRSNAGVRASARQRAREKPVENLSLPPIANFGDEQHRREHLAEYRARFLSQLAHELRTPLTSILGFSEILLGQEELTEAQRGFCQRIQNSAHQLRAILDQLSDLSRLETGQSELFAEEFKMDGLLCDLATALGRQIQKLGVHLTIEMPDQLRIVSDRGKLRQALYNLLSYSLTRSPEGGRIKLRASPIPPDLLIKIEGEGASGTTTGALHSRSDENLAGYSEIGLAIAKESIDLLGGSLALESSLGRGLRISISLPLTGNAVR